MSLRKANTLPIPPSSVFGVVFAFAIAVCNGQGTLSINFDGVPLIAPGEGQVVQGYGESGVLFEPIVGSDGFIRWGGGGSLRPDNGTAYVQASAGDSLMFGFQKGSLFGLDSVDLAGYSTVVPDFIIEFVGYHPDGSTVTNVFSGSGIDFKTYYFDSQ